MVNVPSALDGVEKLVTWCVDDIDGIFFLVSGDGVLGDPVTEGCRALNRYPFFAFQVHAVHLGPHVVATADLMDVLDSTGIIQNPFGQCRLPRVYVGGYSNIPLELESRFVSFCELVNWRRGVGGCFRSDL